MQLRIPPWVLTNVSVLGGARLVNTDYTNNTGRTMFVTVTGICTVTGVGDAAILTPTSGGVVGSSGGISTGSPAMQIRSVVSIMVVPGGVYRVNTTLIGAGTVVLGGWLEGY